MYKSSSCTAVSKVLRCRLQNSYKQHQVTTTALSVWQLTANEMSFAVGSSPPKAKSKIYVTRRVPIRGVELLKPHCAITQWDSDDPVPRDELLKNVQGIDALFCLLTDKIDKDILDAAGITCLARIGIVLFFAVMYYCVFLCHACTPVTMTM